MKNIDKIVTENMIFKCISGSHAYGLNTPESDIDYRGCFMVPLDILLSPFSNIEQIESTKKEDYQYYGIHKFFKLVAENNPNMIELLYMPKDTVLYKHSIYEIIEKNRDLFLSKKAKYTYSGYAFAQLRRMKGHHKWLNNPQPKESPKPIDFISFHPFRLNAKVNYGMGSTILLRNLLLLEPIKPAYNFLNNIGVKLIEGTNKKVFFVYEKGKGMFDKKGFMKTSYKNNYDKNSNIIGILVFQKEAYEETLFKWKQYWTWKKNRNVKRAKLEEKYNMDLKHATHLVRLMIQCKYILKEHYVPVRLPKKDLNFVKDIKQGKMTYDELIKWSNDFEKKLDKPYEKSTLQHSPNIKEIEKLFFAINQEYWNFKEIIK